MSALLELSYEAAVRTLDLQERAVDQLRSRTGTLLAASSLTASFLGAETIRHQGGFDTLVVLALVALAASIVSCVYVLLPTSGLVFSISAPATYEALYEFADDDEEVRRRLGLSDEVCVVVVIDHGLACAPAAMRAPEGRASWPARAAREGTYHHEHDEVQAAPRVGR